jgi:hypothetical protein
MSPVKWRQEQSMMHPAGSMVTVTGNTHLGMDFQNDDKSFKIRVILGQDWPKHCNTISI